MLNIDHMPSRQNVIFNVELQVEEGEDIKTDLDKMKKYRKDGAKCSIGGGG